MRSTQLPDDETLIESLATAARSADLDLGEISLPQRRNVLAGDHRLSVLDWGNEAAESTIVFLHGAGLTARTWDLSCLVLRHQHRCLAVDLRGHGDSEWSPHGDYAPASMAEDIAALIADLGTEPILVGHSLGGLTATHCATTAPESVRALVLVDIGPSSFARGAAATLAGSGAATNEAAALFPPEPQAFETFETFVDHALRLNPRRNRAQLSVSLSHNARALPDGRWTWKYDQRHFGRHAVRSDPRRAESDPERRRGGCPRRPRPQR
jgi:esterase